MTTYDKLSQVVTSYDNLGDLVKKFSRIQFFELFKIFPFQKKKRKLRRFHVDHDISCETQLLELVSLNAVVHLVSAVFVSIPFSTCVVLLITV